MEMNWSSLVEKAKCNDQNAFYELYQNSYDAVYRAVKSMIRDDDIALDIVQDAFVKGFGNLSALDNPDSFLPWMKRIATNKAKDWFKKKQDVTFSQLADENGNEPDFEDERIEYMPEEVIDRDETARLIEEILSTLSDEQRIAVGMFYYQDMSVSQIAQELEISENTVKSRLNYGRKKIRAGVEALEKKGTKLYGLAPIPFLIWLFRGQMAQAATGSAPAAVFHTVMAETAAQGAATTATGGSAGGGLLSTVGAKITAGVLAAVVSVGVGTGIYIAIRTDSDKPNVSDVVSSELAEDVMAEVSEENPTETSQESSAESSETASAETSAVSFEDFGDVFYIMHLRGGTYLTIAEDGVYQLYARYADGADDAAEYRETGAFTNLKQSADGSFEVEVSTVEAFDTSKLKFVRGYRDTFFTEGSIVHIYPAGTSADVLGDDVWIAQDKVSFFEGMYNGAQHIDEDGNFTAAVIWAEGSDAAFVVSSSEDLKDWLNSTYGAFISAAE